MSAAFDCRIELVSDSAAIADRLAELHAACFGPSLQQPWSATAISALLAVPGTLGGVAVGPRDDVLGLVIGRAIGDEAEILTLCVAPAARRCGIATALLEYLCELLGPDRRTLLEVAQTNKAARELYARLGFRQVGRRPDYYRRGAKTADALLLARDSGKNRRPNT